MRILHLAKYYWPRSGGMERVVQDLAEGAAALGHEVSVVAVESRVGGRVGGHGRPGGPEPDLQRLSEASDCHNRSARHDSGLHL